MDNRTLVLDIETRPLTALVWGLKEQFVGLNQIIHDSDIMAWSAKWLGDPPSKIVYRDRRNDKSDEKILRDLWPLLNEAEILITQNGEAFDHKRINARFILRGMKPPKPYQHIDTYKIAKKVADFTSHSLEYLTNNLCERYKKLSHSKFPGMSLWIECLNGNREAWEEMKKYNINDVLSTEELYMKLKAWAPEKTVRIFLDNCRMCGEHVEKRGLTANRKKQRVHCTSSSCGAWDTVALPKETK